MRLTIWTQNKPTLEAGQKIFIDGKVGEIKRITDNMSGKGIIQITYNEGALDEYTDTTTVESFRACLFPMVIDTDSEIFVATAEKYRKDYAESRRRK